jgi:hypothetical protein
VQLTVVVILLGAATLWFLPGPPPAPAAIIGSASIPSTVAGPAVTTAAAESAPAGRAALLIDYPDVGFVGDIFGSQEVAVGADGDSYRVVPIDSLLDPTGTHLMMPGRNGHLTLLDLSTGRQRQYSLDGSGFTRALAFSPDGASVVFGSTTAEYSRWVDQVMLLDVRSGRSRLLRDANSAAVAFAPGGGELAVQVNGAVLVLDATGHQLRRLPAGELAGDDAWSPDGSLLAYQQAGEISVDLVSPTTGEIIAHREALGKFLAWQRPGIMMVSDYSSRIRLAGLAGNPETVVTMPGRTGVDDVASGLIPTLGFRRATTPDRGPWYRRLRWP